MKILCPRCMVQVEKISSDKTRCAECGEIFRISGKISLFRVRLEGGFVKEAMTYAEVASAVGSGKILPSEYVASSDGPWITVYDSPFVSYIPRKGIKSVNRAAAPLYGKNRARRATTAALFVLLTFSATVNVLLLYLMRSMQGRIETLVTQITGG